MEGAIMDEHEKKSSFPDEPEQQHAGMRALERGIEPLDNPFDFSFNFCRGCDEQDQCKKGACMTMR